MKKLTRKFGENNYYVSLKNQTTAFNKLGTLEEIESSRGVSLEILNQIFENGIYGRVKDDCHEDLYIFYFSARDLALDGNKLIVYWEGSDEEYCTYKLSSYGKNYALTEEELL